MSSIYDTAKWIYTPLGGFRTGEQWMVKPLTGAGRVGVTRATNSSRISKSGLIETVDPNIPAIDWINGKPYTGVWGSSTNLVLYSEEFDNAAWVKTNATVVSNDSLAPDGTTTADKFTATADDARLTQNLSLIGLHTQSFYVKSATGSDVSGQIDFGGQGVVLFTANQSWQRVKTSFNLSLGGNPRIRITNSGDSIYIWGAQAEVGSFATPYIPTEGITATRNADNFVASNASSIIGQTQGTVYWEGVLEQVVIGTNRYILDINNGTVDNRFGLFFSSSNNAVNLQIINSSVATGSIINPNIPTGVIKIMYTYQLNNVRLFVNGLLAGTDFSTNIPATNAITFGARQNLIQHLNDHIKLAWGTDEVLTDAQCIALTTL